MSYTQNFLDRDQYLELIREIIKKNQVKLDDELKEVLAGTVPESETEQEKDKSCG